MRKYFVYIDDGQSVYKLAVPANSEEDAKEWCKGNGEIIAVKDVTEHPIYEEKVFDALKNANFTDYEIDFVCRALRRTGITSEFCTPFERGGDL